MRAWVVLFNKEYIEMKRNYKLLWVPVVFLLLGVMQPVSTYFLPEILHASGEIPEGFIIPTPTAADVMVSTFSNYGTIGLLILALAVMSVFSGEINSGMAAMVLVKPVSIAAYVLSKWAAAVLLIWAAFLLGAVGAWYYTLQLIGAIPFMDVWQSTLVYGIWLTAMITVTLLASAWLRSGAAAAGVSLLFTAVLSILSNSLPSAMEWSPARLTAHAYTLLSESHTREGFALSLAAAGLLIVLSLGAAILIMSRKELARG